MKSTLVFISILLAVFIILVVPSMAAPVELYNHPTMADMSLAVLLCAAVSTTAGWLISREQVHGNFLLKLFVCALLVRIGLAVVIFVFNLQDFFGGDALTYDFIGAQQLLIWGGNRDAARVVELFVGKGFLSGWGMTYMVAGVYAAIGRNMLAIQLINAVLGAATAPIIFHCAQDVFSNSRVSRIATVAVAFYPSLVLWSSQGLKDAPIVFLLALAILATLRLGQRFSVLFLLVLIGALFGLLSLRFYVFYMIIVAVAGAFTIGMRAVTAGGFLRQLVVMLAIGLSLTYLGVTRYADAQLGSYVNLETIQRSRQDASTSAKSGFERDVDVSTTQGALSTIPIGLLYLLFAPFPWQLASLRQSITLPEMIVWWASFPMLVLGVWFSIRYRLRQISPILIFSMMLSLAYSVFQGNVGTAYRQRAQLLVFYFIFVAVGYVLMLEKREEQKRRELQKMMQPGLPKRESPVVTVGGAALGKTSHQL